MSTHPHPAEDVLWDYYRGALTPGQSLVVAAHLDMCPACREDIRLFDAVGGVMFNDIEGVAMADNALDLALARIERPEEGVESAAVKHPGFLEGFELPESLKSAVIKDRYWAAPGVWMAPIQIDGSKAEKTYLMFVKAGMVMPEHTHRGSEITLVLKGRFSDKFGEYNIGDMASCDENDSHSPAIAADEDCLCLVWQDATIIPKTFLGKLLQPFARI